MKHVYILYKTVAHSRGREINELTSNYLNNGQQNNIRTNNIIHPNTSNNININLDQNRPFHHQSHSFITQRNNIFDNSNINSEMNVNNANEIQYGTHIDEVFDQLTYAISTEKQNLKNDKANLLKERKKFTDLKKSELLKLQRERQEWLEKIRIVNENKANEIDILDLDIGGTQKITTTRGTLMKVTKY